MRLAAPVLRIGDEIVKVSSRQVSAALERANSGVVKRTGLALEQAGEGGPTPLLPRSTEWHEAHSSNFFPARGVTLCCAKLVAVQESAVNTSAK